MIDGAAALVSQRVPNTLVEAQQCSDSSRWKEAMDAELQSLREYGTWDLVPRPGNVRVLQNRWVYQLKEGTEKARFKARLVVKGYLQNDQGLETCSPVVRYDTIRAVMSVASARGIKMAKFDVKTAYLNGKLKEEVYMDQPDGFNDGTGKVCKLIKSLYGLKQAPRCWGEEMERILISLGSQIDVCLQNQYGKI